MNIDSLKLYTCRQEREQIFCMNSKGTVFFEDGERTEQKESGAVTAAQIFFLISQYLKDQEMVSGERAAETDLQEKLIDGWHMIVTAGSEVWHLQGELKEISAGSTYVSAFIRQRIMIRNMMLFDGKKTGLSFR